MDSEATSPVGAALEQMMHQYRLPQALVAAARLGLADLLADGPRSADDLARVTATHAPTLHRLLRALAGAGVFAEGADGRFGLTPLVAALRADGPDSRRGWIINVGNTEYRAWAELPHTLLTGEPAFARAFGDGFYAYLARHPEVAETWDRFMDRSARAWLAALLASYDFTALRTLVDVGGGRGTALAAILRATPGLRGVLFDLPHVVAGAGTTLADAGVADRCAVVAGDMFAAVPAGGDAYLLARVLWNWDDARAGAILRHCRRAMPDHGRLLVLDLVLPDPPPPQAALSDLNLRLVFGGRLRSEAEFRALLGEAGFTVERVLPAAARYSLIEGRPAVPERDPHREPPRAGA